MILVILSHFALVGQGGKVNLDSGRDVGRRQNSGRWRRKSVFRETVSGVHARLLYDGQSETEQH